MRILVSGASGFLGTALARALRQRGDEVVALSRSAARGDVAWDPARGELDARALEGLDAVVHLAGENLVAPRWTDAKKRAIRDSRVMGTRLLADALARLERRPRVFVGASAVGWFGDRGDALLPDHAPRGAGFLAGVVADWEDAARPVREVGTRLVHLRFGIVLDPDGGALRPMLLPARLGLLGPLGDGRQWWTWITRADAVRAILAALDREDLEGSYNAVAPEAVRQRDFARTLARVLGRPSFLPAPRFALHLALGREMADEMLLASIHAVPERLLAAGFAFQHPALEPALRALLGRA